MGYYSEVAIAIYQEDYSDLLESVSKQSEKLGDDFYEDFFTQCPIQTDAKDDEGNPVVVLHWESEKWYTGYPEIDFITDWLQSHEHQFMRIGEEIDDIEECNTFDNGSSFFAITRQIFVY